MIKSFRDIIKSIAIVFPIAMLFSCSNDIQEVRDFLVEKNLPIGIAENVFNIRTDSGRVDLKLTAPLLYDFSNRKKHPYSEFPDGVRIVTIDKNGDSLVIVGNYAISWTNTSLSEINGKVQVENRKEQKKLKTEQLFWDQKRKYFYTEKAFTLYTATDTIYGVGFDANEDLSMFTSKNNRGSVYINENN